MIFYFLIYNNKSSKSADAKNNKNSVRFFETLPQKFMNAALAVVNLA